VLPQCISKINSLDRLKGERNAYVNKTVFITTQLRFIFKVRLEKKPECTFEELYQLYDCYLYLKSHENEIRFT